MGELEPQGIRIINFNKLSGKEGELLETYFDNEIAPYLSANIISKQQPFPFLQNKEIYAVALLATKGGLQRRHVKSGKAEKTYESCPHGILQKDQQKADRRDM